MKAYEFIAELERLFGPLYRASPGGVYPAITALVQEKLLSVDRDGRAKRYGLTKAGRTVLGERRRQLAAIEERTGARLGDQGSLRPVLDRFAARVMKQSGRIDPALVEAVLTKAADKIGTIEGSRDGQEH
jgi:DNA-binding PadR family transcriptional regulator